MTSSTKTITATISAFTNTVTAGSQYDFTISTLGNPISLKPAAMQAISYTDSNGYSVNSYTSASSVTITNTLEAALTSVSLDQTTFVANNKAIYTFTFTPTNAIPTNAIIVLKYPASITPSTTPVCTGVTGIPSGTTLE